MSELHFPWLGLSVVAALVGAVSVARVRDPSSARRLSLIVCGLLFVLESAAWLDFELMQTSLAGDRWCGPLTGRGFCVIDRLSTPLLPLVTLLYFLTSLATLRTQIRRFSFAWNLAAEAIVLATFTCKSPWGIIVLLSLGTVPPFLELQKRGKSARVYTVHMLLFIFLMIAGWSFVEREGDQHVHTVWSVVPLLGAVFIRCGIVPFHCWMRDLFDKATFGTALLFVAPIAGAYLAVRLVLPVADDWVLRSIGIISLFTAVYAAGMALIQREARRLFCFLFLSHSALVLVGLEVVTPMALTGALCVWLSAALALAGFGLTLRALEARRGRLVFTEYQGLYEHTPALAVCFLLTGLASVGFPGTAGFVGTELLVDGVVEAYPFVGIAVVVAAAINGIALVQAYFLLFTGTRYTSSISLQIGGRERFAVLLLAAFILIGGVIPQRRVASRQRAATELLEERSASIRSEASSDDHSASPSTAHP